MGASLDMERIAEELGAERRGKVLPRGGFFGALQLAAEVMTRFRVLEGGWRVTDPSRQGEVQAGNTSRDGQAHQGTRP